jgi:hypothetical protein
MRAQALLTSSAIVLSLSGCIDPSMLMDQAYPASQTGSSERVGSSSSSGSALGSWAGNITYTPINGRSFVIGMQVHVRGSSVTTTVGGSGVETLAAIWNGSAVSWASFGQTTVTEWTIAPASARSAKVTSSVSRNGAVIARGAGILVRQ